MIAIMSDYSQTIIGIDPGKSGGFAICDGGIITSFNRYPENIHKLKNMLVKVYDTYPYITAYMELVHAFPTDARSAAFKFGTNYGIWMGLLEGINIDCKFVAPQVWMKTLGLPKDKQNRKHRIKTLAQNIIDKQKIELLNSEKRITLKTSDAILISGYGYIKERVEHMNINKKLEIYKIFKEKEIV